MNSGIVFSNKLRSCSVMIYETQCFDEHLSEKVTREIASRKLLCAVLRDNNLISSPEMINVFEISELPAPIPNVKEI